MLQADKGTAGLVVPSIFKLYTNLTSAYVQHITPASGPLIPEQRQVVRADVLHAGVREIRDAMAADMRQRFAWTKLRHFGVASLLDPRTKTLSEYHVPEGCVADAWRLLRWHLDKAIRELKAAELYESRGVKRDAAGMDEGVASNHPFAAENRRSMASSVSAALALTDAVHADGRFVLAPAGEPLTHLQDVQRELSAYMRLPVEAMASCPLTWWRQHRQFFPGLAIVAREFLCTPATSAAVERFFSAGGITINHLRTRLSSKSVEQLLFLKLNWDDSLYNVRLPKKAAAAAAAAATAADGGGGGEDEVVVVGEEEEEEEEDGLEGEMEEEEGLVDEDDNDAALFALTAGMGALFEGEDFGFMDDEAAEEGGEEEEQAFLN